MSKLYDKLYKSSSMTLKALGLLPSYRIFRKWYKFLQKSQWWSREQLEEYQLERLGSLLHHAYENVPYYSKVFDERGLKPKDIQDFKDLEKLPYLDKNIVLENLDNLKAKNFSLDKFEYVTTGGSTGTMGLYYEKGTSRAMEWAFMKTQWDRVGYKFLDKCVVLRGYQVESSKNSVIARKSFFNRWLVVSPFKMTEKTLPDYIEQIWNFNPSFIQAYPSTLQIVANYMKINNIKPNKKLKAVLCGSENLHESLQELFKDVFQTRIYSWYGHSEQAVLAGACEYNDLYHVFPEYGIFEVIDEQDNVLKKHKTHGEVVATGLNNYYMPLIRYKTGDIVTMDGEVCECGRNYDLIKNVEGRKQDFIVLKDNNIIPLTSLIIAVKHLEHFPSIIRFQFIQREPGRVKLRIMGDKQKIIDDSARLKHGIFTVLGNQLDAEIEYVDYIPLTKRGKHRRLIQKISLNDLTRGFQ